MWSYFFSQGAKSHAFYNFAEGSFVYTLSFGLFLEQDSPEVHANAAETLCAIIRYAPPGLAVKISSPRYSCVYLVSFSDFMCSKLKSFSLCIIVCIASIYCSFVERLFRHALEDSRPKSVLVHSLSVCISLLDPKRLTASFYHSFRCRTADTSVAASNPKTVEGMLESLGKITTVSSRAFFCLSSKAHGPLSCTVAITADGSLRWDLYAKLRMVLSIVNSSQFICISYVLIWHVFLATVKKLF